MRSKIVGTIAGGLTVITLIAIAVTWYFMYLPPGKNLLPMPSNLVSLHTNEGENLLESSKYKEDFDVLSSNFIAQNRFAFCGVATSAIVFNSLSDSKDEKITQDEFFSHLKGRGTKSEFGVTFSGMTLDELGLILTDLGISISVHHASKSSFEEFLSVAKQNMKREGDYLVVNYARKVLGQNNIGHISPVAAYNDASESFLILDVAAHNYPPTWVKAEDLWDAMNTVDTSVGSTRGYIVVN